MKMFGGRGLGIILLVAAAAIPGFGFQRDQPCKTLPNTEGGTKDVLPCVFPFRFGGETHRGCTVLASPEEAPWCSVEVDGDGNHVGGKGLWGLCDCRYCNCKGTSEEEVQSRTTTTTTSTTEATTTTSTTPPDPKIHGSWGEWSDSGPCSNTCGRGTVPQSRPCDSPPPSNGGRFCEGAPTRHMFCNLRDCVDEFRPRECGRDRITCQDGRCIDRNSRCDLSGCGDGGCTTSRPSSTPPPPTTSSSSPWSGSQNSFLPTRCRRSERQREEPCLLTSARDNDVRRLARLIKQGEYVDVRDSAGNTALIVAAANGNIEAAEFLLHFDADIDARNTNGWTPLHVAAQSGEFEAIRLLLRRGADKDARDDVYGWTPLHVAARYGHLGVVRLMLSHGADPRATTTRGGRRPSDLALMQSHYDVRTILLNAEGRSRDYENFY